MKLHHLHIPQPSPQPKGSRQTIPRRHRRIRRLTPDPTTPTGRQYGLLGPDELMAVLPMVGHNAGTPTFNVDKINQETSVENT
jgi:hypothetical protein